MSGKTARAGLCAIIAAICLFGFVLPGHAVELNGNPYIQPLRPAGPTIPGSSTSAATPKCYGAVCPTSRAATPPPLPGSNHIRWCTERYRSYRASDNTYQPLTGPRTRCVSPFQQ
ncbi:BA14K family protein [Daeguia caeni]|uniref:Lectin-like protein BA14k n=1 Tax=Daeguia caeni TaxID=439612 RepID=A0ABV9H589_9HYPH